MLTLIKEYRCLDVPDEKDIQDAIHIANTEGCIVRILYAVFGCPYELYVTDADSVESVESRIPDEFGI